MPSPRRLTVLLIESMDHKDGEELIAAHTDVHGVWCQACNIDHLKQGASLGEV